MLTTGYRENNLAGLTSRLHLPGLTSRYHLLEQHTGLLLPLNITDLLAAKGASEVVNKVQLQNNTF